MPHQISQDAAPSLAHASRGEAFRDAIRMVIELVRGRQAPRE